MRGTRLAAARTGSGRAWPGRAPLLAAVCGCAALTVVMYGVNFRAAYGPPILVVAPVVGANAVMLVAAWLAWRVHPEDRDAAGQTFREVVVDPGRPRRAEMRIAHVDGGWRWVRVTFTNLLHDPAVGGIVTNTSDITEAHAYHVQLSHQATHDALTDLANRTLFAEQVELALARHDRQVSLALVDLDDFKWVNDTLGHPVGDALLVAVAERLRRGVRPGDLVARLGGDEFAVLLDDCDPAEADTTVGRVLQLVTEPLVVESHTLRVRASIGIADAGPDDDADRLMRHADLALYEAKGAGKGCSARYTPAMQPRPNIHTDLHQVTAARKP